MGKYIFESICSGFIDDEVDCSSPNINSNNDSDYGISGGTVFLIVLLIFIIFVLLVICYRRIVLKSLETTLNEKIQTQTIHSLTQYQVFKDDNTRVTGGSARNSEVLQLK